MISVQWLLILPGHHEEGLLHPSRVWLRREIDGDVPVQPGRTEADLLPHEGTRHATTLLVASCQVSERTVFLWSDAEVYASL